MSRFQQGFYTPKHLDKYVVNPFQPTKKPGGSPRIRYLSSWELQLHEFFDNNPNVIRWSSEGVAIPYVQPTDGKIHRYYPDYWVEFRNTRGQIVQEIIEVKPKTQTRAPRANSKRKLLEAVQYAVNIAKWRACQQWCKQRNIAFRVVTETSIFK